MRHVGSYNPYTSAGELTLEEKRTHNYSAASLNELDGIVSRCTVDTAEFCIDSSKRSQGLCAANCSREQTANGYILESQVVAEDGGDQPT